jgi:hypothetical protein
MDNVGINLLQVEKLSSKLRVGKLVLESSMDRVSEYHSQTKVNEIGAKCQVQEEVALYPLILTSS